MIKLLFFKICYAALAKNGIDPEGYIKVPYELDIGYQFSRTKNVKMCFSKVVRNCITNEGFKGEGDHNASEPGRESKYLVKFQRSEKVHSGKCRSNTPEDYSEFPYLRESIKIFITKDEINEVFKNGKTVMIKLGNTTNYDYNRVSILISPFSFGDTKTYYPNRSYVKETNAYYNNGSNSYTIFFENMITKHYLSLPNSQKLEIQKELKNIASSTEKEFLNKYGNKMLLLTDINFVHLKKFYKTISDLPNRNGDARLIVEYLIDSITSIYPKLKLGDCLPIKEKRSWFIAEHEDLYTTSITYGILTDVLNIMRFAIDKNAKFQIYELFDTEKEATLDLSYNFKFTFDGANDITKDNIKILTNMNSIISNFTNHTLNGVLYLDVNLEDIVAMKYQMIRVNFDFNNRKLTTFWISVSTDPITAPNVPNAFSMPSRRNESSSQSNSNQMPSQSNPNFMPSRRTAN